ncbi:hypothetical protein BDY21DRAFT_350482 [Lineolata rhizophorae]|uniref:Uncharacterized protein n=1 Tax=Lineolata rhizophorae TaxID=578093 RepID=A0A6A6NUT7_9PEZI|nr:hypothetical protein BDY21DRAFT_350482 [Lineolata rhizophorae]
MVQLNYLTLGLLACLVSSAVSIPMPWPLSSLFPRQASGQQIRGVRDPIYHLYLQDLDGKPVLGPEESADTFDISGTIQSTTTGLYLTIGESDASYMPITWSEEGTTTAWGLEGDTIITTQSSSYGRQLNWVVCADETSGYYDIYLQTGADVPPGDCSNYQTLHLPCLC